MSVMVGEVFGSPLIVKLVFEISKKILSEASTLIRAFVVERFGTVINWVPSLGVLAARTVPKVRPPSVESKMLTLAALIGEAVVPATSQVTVWLPPAVQVTAELGLVI